MTRLKLRDHPRWALYCKIRRAIARELEAERRRQGLAQSVTVDDVDAYLEDHLDRVLEDMAELFWSDLAANTCFMKPSDAPRALGGLH